MNNNHPPDSVAALNDIFWRHIHRGRRYLNWRGTIIVKQPGDIILYEEEIWKSKPDFIIDVGTRYGGSALFFGDMLEMTGKGHVLSIDRRGRNFPTHPRVTYLTGSSTDNEIINEVKNSVGGKGSVMVVLDSDHTRDHVKLELHHYSKIVTSGQALVIEDCYLPGPREARDWFLKKNNLFRLETPEDQVLVAYSRGGWLRKI